ncbi:ArsR family transcriptional regulator [Roseomonas sp. NAR14]|uniref:ArsR family transcriptional regulator n=1 Tax=Roseomonas acroporae TaxID=2937791 RepID=A0A9X1YEW9_9PROT|nr:helix-turn-helix transcriptional regulator [Roseomonas acroporae]MCK8787442.1 ArsR family transcriptional regulator [Roseomonas acroporae]
MLSTAAFAGTAALAGDPARASMLLALMDGRALTATELAGIAGIAPQTASGHLLRLAEGGLLAVERQGRHRYHRLASPAVAAMLEGIMAASAGLDGQAPGRAVAARIGPRDRALRRARTCYDHLAGRLAVAMTDRMVARGQVELSADGGALTGAGDAFLRGLGVDLDSATRRGGARSGRVFCRPCLDWSERRPHLAGAVGAALCRACFAHGWLRRLDGTRAVAVTPAGRLALGNAFDLPAEAWEPAAGAGDGPAPGRAAHGPNGRRGTRAAPGDPGTGGPDRRAGRPSPCPAGSETR